MQRRSLMLPVLALTFVAPACDDPGDEAELQALDIENGPDDLTLAAEKSPEDNVKPEFDKFDLKAKETPAAGPPGKCCKAICSWNPGVWHQLPWNVTENCNDYAQLYCGYYNVVDAQWRTCG